MSDILNKPLNPASYLKASVAYKEAVTRATDKLQQVQEELERTRTAHHTELKQQKERMLADLDRGATTGDPLHDQLLRIYGFDDKNIQPVLAFNEKLKANQGKVLAVLKAENRETGVVHGGHYETSYTLYVGLIEGELGFKLGKNDRLSYTLPVGTFFKTDPTKSSKNGNLVQKQLVTDAGYNDAANDVENLFIHGNPFVESEIRHNGDSCAWFYVGDEIESSLKERKIFLLLFHEEKLAHYIEAVRTAPDEDGIIPIGGS